MSILARFKRKLSKDFHFAEILRWASISFSIKIGAAGIGFILNLILARKLGAEGVGQYFLIFSILQVALIFGKFGADKSILRFISPAAVQNKWSEVQAIVREGTKIVLLNSILVTLFLMLSADYLSTYVFHRADLGNTIRIFSLTIIPLSFSNVFSEMFKGIKKITIGLSLSNILLPLLTIVLIFFLVQSNQVEGAIWSTVIAQFLEVGLAIYLWRYLTKEKYQADTSEASAFSRSEFLNSSKPLFWASLFQQINVWSPTFMLGIWETDENIGIFSVAKRVASLTSMFLIAFNSIVAPKVGEFYAKQDFEGLSKLCQKTTLLIILLVSPVFAALFIFPEFVLNIFGKSFGGGQVALSILLIGQLVNILLGPVGVILVMCGQENLSKNTFALAAISTLLLNILLIPTLGLSGAAIATTASMILQNVVAYWYVVNRVGVRTLPTLSMAKRLSSSIFRLKK